jgi:phage terminase large subunit-like protein
MAATFATPEWNTIRRCLVWSHTTDAAAFAQVDPDSL